MVLVITFDKRDPLKLVPILYFLNHVNPQSTSRCCFMFALLEQKQKCDTGDEAAMPQNNDTS